MTVRLLRYALLAFAFGWVWICGHRGYFLLDQSEVFDGGWRVLQGQVPFRGFQQPYGPLIYWTQALFFRIAGVNFTAMVLPAAILNACAAAVTMSIVRRVPTSRNWHVLAAGAVTAVWFQAPFGTLYFEQLAFFLALAATRLLLEDRADAAAAAGACVVLSFLAKQNAAILFLPLALGAIALGHRRFGAFFGGVGAAAMAFAAWAYVCSNPGEVWRQMIELPRYIAKDRISDLTTFTVRSILLRNSLVFPVTSVAIALSGLVALYRRQYLAAWLVVASMIMTDAYTAVTLNEPQNCLSFLGLAVGFAVRGAPAAVAAPVLAIVLYTGLDADWNRVMHGFDHTTAFPRTLTTPGMERLRWAQPHEVAKGAAITADDFEALNRFLASAGGNFFVFPDTTILYGLHRRPSPQPYLYFLEGHSFLPSERDTVDRRTTEALERNNIRTVVLETGSWMGTHRQIERMPRLRAWIDENFAKSAAFGIYEVWTRKRPSQAKTPASSPLP